MIFFEFLLLGCHSDSYICIFVIFTNLETFWLSFKYFCPIFSFSETPVKCKLDLLKLSPRHLRLFIFLLFFLVLQNRSFLLFYFQVHWNFTLSSPFCNFKKNLDIVLFWNFFSFHFLCWDPYLFIYYELAYFYIIDINLIVLKFLFT